MACPPLRPSHSGSDPNPLSGLGRQPQRGGAYAQRTRCIAALESGCNCPERLGTELRRVPLCASRCAGISQAERLPRLDQIDGDLFSLAHRYGAPIFIFSLLVIDEAQ